MKWAEEESHKTCYKSVSSYTTTTYYVLCCNCTRYTHHCTCTEYAKEGLIIRNDPRKKESKIASNLEKESENQKNATQATTKGAPCCFYYIFIRTFSTSTRTFSISKEPRWYFFTLPSAIKSKSAAWHCTAYYMHVLLLLLGVPTNGSCHVRPATFTFMYYLKIQHESSG